MPRGKYVNHKGRSRHFTSPEELQQENEEESSENESSADEEENENDAAAGATGGPREKSTKSAAKKKDNDESGEDSDEESSEDDDRDKRKGVASLIKIENPNRSVKKSIRKVGELSLEELPKPELTRRDREQLEKQKARILYEKLHAAGKTHEAKADLARLALIRQQRAEAAAKREAEKKVGDDKKGKA